MMTSKPLRLLLIEDSSDDELLLLNALTEAGYEAKHQRVETAEDLQEALQTGVWDVVISDYRLPSFDGLSALEIVRKRDRDTPFLFVSGTVMDEVGVAAMRGGANDYLMKSNLARLGPALDRELKEAANRRQTLVTKVQYRAILDSTLDAILVAKESGYIQIFNKGAETTFGYSAAEVLGQHIGILLPGDAFEHLKCTPAKPLMESGNTRVYDSRYIVLDGRHQDGHDFPIEASCAKALNEGHRIYTIVIRDISQRLAAERALRDSEERLRLLMDNIRDYAIIMLDTEGRVTTWNQGAANLTGYEAEEAVGRPLSIFYPPEDVSSDKPQQLLKQAIDEGRSAEEGWRIRKDGSRFYAEVILTAARDANRELFGVTKITRDITEHRAMEDQLRRHREELETRVAERTRELEQARHQAERLARSKSDFLANMSHEIRTPMNAVLGLGYMLEQQDLPEDALDLAHKINQSGQALLGIINDILDFSKIESGRIEIERAPFELSGVLDNLATIMTATADQDQDLELVIKPPDCVDLTLIGDSLRLGQVLINLSSNAIKFTRSGLVEVQIETLERTDSRVRLKFSVIDTGIGIDKNAQARLFQPFSQADASTTRRFGGSGLGLAISRRLVDLMGGHMGVRSTLGEGSTFWFEIAFELAEQQTSQAPQDAHRIRVLVAENNPVVREALAATVATLGWTVRQAASGDQALAIVLEDPELQRPNAVVLLDSRMPDRDGIATAHAIRTALPADRQPLIFVLGVHRRDSLLDASETGAVDAVLSKPVTPSQLYNAVIRKLSQRQGEPSQPPPATSQRLAGLRLLVVDDSDINRKVASSIFDNEGAEINLAGDGREAVDWLIAHPDAVDLVLMDVQMPVMDGHDATRLIRRTPSIAQLPVVALTAGALREQETAALEAGMDGFLSKPFDVAKAVALIRRLTERKEDNSKPTPEPRTDAVSASIDATAPPSVESLPHLAVARGLDLWKDPEVYRKYLRRFAHEFGDSATRLRDMEPSKARRYLHRLKGAANNLALARLAARAQVLEHTWSDPLERDDAAAEMDAFRNSLVSALDAIQAYAPKIERPSVRRSERDAIHPEDVDPALVSDLLQQALAAFERFDPIAAEPLLRSLAQHLPGESLAEAWRAAEEFDSTAGSAAILALAARLTIPLEEP
ncbi:response regulator [Thiorhodococcus fuscus]|uniref:histidine kinase n=1 Tax=Thiorhodococcus fuscus TaxID=527200 RepID=A0ABW4YCA8_9GAMM